MHVDKVGLAFELTGIEQFLVTEKPEADALEPAVWSFYLAGVLYRQIVHRLKERERQQFPGQTLDQIVHSSDPQPVEDRVLLAMAEQVLPYAVNGMCKEIATFLSNTALGS